MIFESKQTNLVLLRHPENNITFTPDPDTAKLPPQEQRGRLDTASARTLEQTGGTTDEVDKAIMATSTFKEGIASKSGIWLRDRRVEIETSLNTAGVFRQGLEQFTEEQLRGMLTGLQRPYPAKAEKAELIGLICNDAPQTAAEKAAKAKAGKANADAEKK